MARQLVLAAIIWISLGTLFAYGQDSVRRPRVPTPASPARELTPRQSGTSAARPSDDRYSRGSIYGTGTRTAASRATMESPRGPQLAGASREAEPARFDEDAEPSRPSSSTLPSVLKRRAGSSEPAEMPLPAEPEPMEDDADFDQLEGLDPLEDDQEEAFSTSRRANSPPAVLPSPSRYEVESRPPGAAGFARSRAADRSSGGSDIRVSSRAPNIRLEVEGPGAVSMGKEARYVLVASNEGAEAARNLEIRLQTPAHARLGEVTVEDGEIRQVDDETIVWTIGQLGGNTARELQLSVTPLKPEAIELAVQWSVHPQPIQAAIEVQQPSLVVEIAGPNDILFGESQIYTITLRNPGTGPAENVTLDVATGGGAQSKKMGTILPGGEEKIRMELIARESGDLEIASVATADGIRQEARKSVLVRRAELTVEVTAPRMKFAGSSGTYEVLVRNTGNAPANEVDISLRKPAGVRYLSGVDSAVESGGRIGWQLPILDAGQQRLYRVQVAFEEAGDVVCEAVVSSADELTASAAIETFVEAVADLKLAINDPESPQSVGDEVTYEIRVTNRGSQASGSISVLAHFSDGIEPARATGGAAELLTGQVIFEPLAGVKPGETIMLKVVARAEKAGNHRFRAVLKCDDPEIEVMAESVTRFFSQGAATDAGAPARVSRSASSSAIRR